MTLSPKRHLNIFIAIIIINLHHITVHGQLSGGGSLTTSSKNRNKKTNKSGNNTNIIAIVICLFVVAVICWWGYRRWRKHRHPDLESKAGLSNAGQPAFRKGEIWPKWPFSTPRLLRIREAQQFTTEEKKKDRIRLHAQEAKAKQNRQEAAWEKRREEEARRANQIERQRQELVVRQQIENQRIAAREEAFKRYPRHVDQEEFNRHIKPFTLLQAGEDVSDADAMAALEFMNANFDLEDPRHRKKKDDMLQVWYKSELKRAADEEEAEEALRAHEEKIQLLKSQAAKAEAELAKRTFDRAAALAIEEAQEEADFLHQAEHERKIELAKAAALQVAEDQRIALQREVEETQRLANEAELEGLRVAKEQMDIDERERERSRLARLVEESDKARREAEDVAVLEDRDRARRDVEAAEFLARAREEDVKARKLEADRIKRANELAEERIKTKAVEESLRMNHQSQTPEPKSKHATSTRGVKPGISDHRSTYGDGLQGLHATEAKRAAHQAQKEAQAPKAAAERLALDPETRRRLDREKTLKNQKLANTEPDATKAGIAEQEAKREAEDKRQLEEAEQLRDEHRRKHARQLAYIKKKEKEAADKLAKAEEEVTLKRIAENQVRVENQATERRREVEKRQARQAAHTAQQVENNVAKGKETRHNTVKQSAVKNLPGAAQPIGKMTRQAQEPKKSIPATKTTTGSARQAEQAAKQIPRTHTKKEEVPQGTGTQAMMDRATRDGNEKAAAHYDSPEGKLATQNRAEDKRLIEKQRRAAEAAKAERADVANRVAVAYQDDVRGMRPSDKAAFLAARTPKPRPTGGRGPLQQPPDWHEELKWIEITHDPKAPIDKDKAYEYYRRRWDVRQYNWLRQEGRHNTQDDIYAKLGKLSRDPTLIDKVMDNSNSTLREYLAALEKDGFDTKLRGRVSEIK